MHLQTAWTRLSSAVVPSPLKPLALIANLSTKAPLSRPDTGSQRRDKKLPRTSAYSEEFPSLRARWNARAAHQHPLLCLRSDSIAAATFVGSGCKCKSRITTNLLTSLPSFNAATRPTAKEGRRSCSSRSGSQTVAWDIGSVAAHVGTCRCCRDARKAAPTKSLTTFRTGNGKACAKVRETAGSLWMATASHSRAILGQM